MAYQQDGEKQVSDQLYFEDPEDSDNAVTIFANADGGLTISIAEEQAVDSYNEEFECTFYLTGEQAKKLRDLLNNTWPIGD